MAHEELWYRPRCSRKWHCKNFVSLDKSMFMLCGKRASSFDMKDKEPWCKNAVPTEKQCIDCKVVLQRQVRLPEKETAHE